MSYVRLESQCSTFDERCSMAEEHALFSRVNHLPRHEQRGIMVNDVVYVV